MTAWLVEPLVAVGPVRLGATAQEVDVALGMEGADVTVLTGFPRSRNYDPAGVRISLDSEGFVREIEVFSPAQPMIASRPVLEMDHEASQEAFRNAGCQGAQTAAEGIEWPDCGIRLWLPHGVVETLVLFDPAVRAPERKLDDLLQDLGIEDSR